jgi:D-alanine-D-alanine ligase
MTPGDRSTAEHRPRICVLSGGPTAESRASHISAAGVYDALTASGYDSIWLDLSEAETWEVRAADPPVSPVLDSDPGPDSAPWQEAFASLVRASGVELAFPAIHGPIGEDGQLQALCESLSLPCVGCDSKASIACYDKALFKQLVHAAGLPVTPWVSVERRLHEDNPAAVTAAVERELSYPCIVKPSRSGSSLGLARVEARDALDAAIAQALAFDDIALVERLFAGVDVEIGVLGGGPPVIGSPVELEYDGFLYDFETKYADDRDRRYLPARFPAALIDRLTQAASAAFFATGCHGMARVDLLVNASTGRFIVNEINTVPYMPKSSTFATSLCHATGQSYRCLITDLVQVAWHAHRYDS